MSSDESFLASRGLRAPRPSDLERLQRSLGEGRLERRPWALERYASDECTRLRALPDAVVRPGSVAEVSTVLRWASEGPFAVVPRGAGTGVAGGAVPVGGGVVLSLERLDRILEVDDANLTATCEPAVITGRLHETVEAAGLFYPPDPASLASCSIGGNVAVGAGGARAVKYGTTRNYVLGAEVVLSNGSVLALGSKNVKDASGYHLLDLLIGSEGTLAVITQVTLRLLPLPSHRITLLLPFADLAAATAAVARLARERIVPSVAEFMDDVTIGAARRYLGRDLPGGVGAGAYVLIELDGENPSLLEEEMLRVGRVGEQAGALEVLVAQDAGQQARLWESRRCLAEALRALSPEIAKADVVVPRARVSALVADVKRAGERHGLVAACFGHAGDGNVHVNLLRRNLDEDSWSLRLSRTLDEVLDATCRLGGLPSGEHGIGVLKRPHLARFLPPENLEIMRRVKTAFDPSGILNPGKVL